MPDETKDPQAEAATTPPVVEPQVTATPVEEPFDKDRAMATINKLRETEKQAKKDAKELETLKAEKSKRDEAEMTESQRNAKRADEAEAKTKQLETDVMRRDVIAETGLPALFTDRLKGTTKEEMLLDAQELAKTLPQLKTAPKLPPTNPSNAQNVNPEAEVRAKLWPNSSRLDKETIARLGGGVVMKE